MDSFVQLVTIAGIISLITLAWCLITRVRKGAGNRGVFQRMPVLLPSVVFVVSVLLILQLGLIPMSEYRGINHSVFRGAIPRDNMRYTVYESNIAYIDDVEVTLQTYLEADEYFSVNIVFVENETIVYSVDVDVTPSSLEEGVYTFYIDVEPGVYTVNVDGTVYKLGVPQEEYSYLDIVLNQPIQQSFLPEIVDWSSYQFLLFFGCIFFIIGGFCIGRVDRDRMSEEEIDKEPPRGDEYLRPFH